MDLPDLGDPGMNEEVIRSERTRSRLGALEARCLYIRLNKGCVHSILRVCRAQEPEVLHSYPGLHQIELGLRKGSPTPG